MSAKRKLRLIRFDETQNLWVCSYFSYQKGSNVKLFGYVNAPQNFVLGEFVKGRKSEKPVTDASQGTKQHFEYCR